MYHRMKFERYKLHGSMCKKCKIISYPIENLCSKCGEKSDIIELPTTGIVISNTTIYVSPKGFDAPYSIALVKLDVKEKKFKALDDMIIPVNDVIIPVQTTEKVEIGDVVCATFRKISESENGVINYGLKFEKV